MTRDTGISEPVSQKPYPIAIKHYQWFKEEINNLPTTKLIWRSWSSWSAPIIDVPRGDGWKCLVIDYHALNKVTWKFIWPMLKVEVNFSQLNETKYFSMLDLQAGYHHIPLDELSIPKTAFTSPFGKYEYITVTFGLMQAPVYFKNSWQVSQRLTYWQVFFHLDDIVIFSRMAEEHLSHIKHIFENWGKHSYQWSLANVISSQRKSSIWDTFSAPKALDLYHKKPKS